MSDARDPEPLDYPKGAPDRVEPSGGIEDVTVEIIDEDATEESLAPVDTGDTNGR